MDSTARTDSTRSARSSAREVREASRSARAAASSGEVAEVVRERMRRYEVKRGRVDWSWVRTSLFGFVAVSESVWRSGMQSEGKDGHALLDLEERVLVVC